MPGPPSGPVFALTSLYAARLPEQKFTALANRNGPDGPLVVYPPDAPPGAKVQKPTRWVSTNARDSPITNKAILLDFAAWELRVLISSLLGALAKAIFWVFQPGPISTRLVLAPQVYQQP